MRRFSYPFARRLRSGLLIANARAEHAEQLETLQNVVFPTLAPEERFRAEHYRKHLELFPEGQFVALNGGRVVGAMASLRVPESFGHGHHTFAEVIAGGWMTSHDPRGPWVYGADTSTHPDYRRRGIARGLYAARQELARALGLLGQVEVGMLNGFAAVADRLSLEEYYARVVDPADPLTDPTVTAQLRIGFEPRGLLRDYLNDPQCGNAGALIVLLVEKDVEADWAD